MKTKTTLLLLAMASFLASMAPAQTVGGIKNITDNKAGISYNANARTVISNYTVQPEDHTILVDSTTAAPSGASYTVVTNASGNVIKGKQISVAGDAGDTGASDDTISFVDGQAVAGDRVEVWCDGTSWFAIGISNVAAGLTFTTAI